MTARRLRLIGTAFAVVAVVALAWLLGAGPLLGQAAATDAQLAATTAVNDAQAARLAALAADAGHLAELQSQQRTSDAALPPEPSLAAFFQELGDLQRGYAVTVTGYTGAAAVAAGATAPTGTTAPAAGAAASATPAPTPTPTATAAPPAAAPATTSAAATPTGGLYRIPMELQVAGSYKHLLSFVGGLQSGPRLFLVDRVAISAATTGSGFTATVSGSVYVLPAGAGG
jgi:Tfp pilus assembly protein PilO